MFRRAGTDRQSSADWLPWGLSVFVAGCAAFVLFAGVLPERAANRELKQEVARLQTDLARTSENANASLQDAKAQLMQQDLSTQARVKEAREQERARAVLEAARRDLSQSLAREIGDGAVALEERDGELVVVVSERLLFQGDTAALKASGRIFIRELGRSIQRLPAGQVYQLGGGDERRQRNFARFLEITAKLPRERLVLRGNPESGLPQGASAGAGTFQIVLTRRQR